MTARPERPIGDGTACCVLIALLALVISACGFHLRGDVELPEDMRNIYVDTNDERLKGELGVLLADGGGTVVKARDDADVILMVGPGRFERRVLSFDPDTGKELEIEISYALPYSAKRLDGETLQARRVLTLQRNYIFDSSALLGTTRQESTLRQEMQADAVEQVLRQLGEKLVRTP